MAPDLKVVASQFSRSQASHLTTGGGDGTSGGMETRVSKLEADMTEIKVSLGRIEERLTAMTNSLATKADVAEIKGELRGKLGYWQFLATGVTLLGLGIATATLVARLVFNA